MKFVTISDVHIKEPGDLPERLFLKFLNGSEVADSYSIFLLGDIFDLFIGPHVEHKKKYASIYDKLSKLANEGRKIFFFEGNHDFHFRKLVESQKNWFYYNEPLLIEINKKRILFAHGDEIERNNITYQRYRTFIRSNFIRLAAEDLVPYSLVDKIGRHFSKKSRERNIKNYGTHNENEPVKNKFRENILWAHNEFSRPDMIFCGHSHCAEAWITADFEYYNNGFFPASKKFHFYDGNEVRAISLQAD